MTDESTPGKVTSENDRPPTVTERVHRSAERLLGAKHDDRGVHDSDIAEDTKIDLGLVRSSLTLLGEGPLHVKPSNTDPWVVFPRDGGGAHPGGPS